MAYEAYSDSDVIRMKAGAAVTKHRAVKLDTTVDTVIHSVAIADLTVGVSLNTVASGEWVSVQVRGIAKLEAAAAITLGDEVMVQAASADGSIATSAGATARSLGVALEGATNGDADVISVLLRCPTLKGPANS